MCYITTPNDTPAPSPSFPACPCPEQFILESRVRSGGWWAKMEEERTRQESFVYWMPPWALGLTARLTFYRALAGFQTIRPFQHLLRFSGAHQQVNRLYNVQENFVFPVFYPFWSPRNGIRNGGGRTGSSSFKFVTFLSDVPLQHKEMKLIPCDSLPFISAITEVGHYRAMLYQASGFITTPSQNHCVQNTQNSPGSLSL